MPDLVTHAAGAYLVTRCRRWQQYRILIYLGAILPDLLSRPFYILFPELFKLTTAGHTPIFVGIFCLFFSQFFDLKMRTPAFLALLAGSALHFGMDVFQRHLVGGYYWFFPFSWQTFEWGLFWPEDTVRFIPVWLVLILVMELLLWYQKSHFMKSAA